MKKIVPLILLFFIGVVTPSLTYAACFSRITTRLSRLLPSLNISAIDPDKARIVSSILSPIAPRARAPRNSSPASEAAGGPQGFREYSAMPNTRPGVTPTAAPAHLWQQLFDYFGIPRKFSQLLSKEDLKEIFGAAKEIEPQVYEILKKRAEDSHEPLNKLLDSVATGLVNKSPQYFAKLRKSAAPQIYRLAAPLGIGAVVLAVGGVSANRLIGKTIKSFYQPALIEKQSSVMERWFRKPVQLSDAMVVSDKLKTDLEYATKMTANTKKNGGTYENILMYGPPGTGKTLFGRYLAQNSGLKFFLVPAANVSQFLASGTVVQELNDLFSKAEKQPNGALIFFDEIETLVGDRSKLSAQAQHALGLFLAKTGSPSSKISIVGATNLPQAIDDAMLSRFGLKIEFGLPSVQSRKEQLDMHIKKVFKESEKTARFWQRSKKPSLDYSYLKNNTETIAKQIESFSGREIQQLVNRVRQVALAQDKLTVDARMVNDIVEKYREDKKRFSKNNLGIVEAHPLAKLKTVNAQVGG